MRGIGPSTGSEKLPPFFSEHIEIRRKGRFPFRYYSFVVKAVAYGSKNSFIIVVALLYYEHYGETNHCWLPQIEQAASVDCRVKEENERC